MALRKTLKRNMAPTGHAMSPLATDIFRPETLPRAIRFSFVLGRPRMFTPLITVPPLNPLPYVC